jgi:hypothetical protein
MCTIGAGGVERNRVEALDSEVWSTLDQERPKSKGRINRLVGREAEHGLTLYSGFGFRASGFFRPSGFGLRISAPLSIFVLQAPDAYRNPP